VLFEKFGITAEAVVAKARALARVPQPLPG